MDRNASSDKDPLLPASTANRRKSSLSANNKNRKLSDVTKEFSRRQLMEKQHQQADVQPVMKNLFYKEKKAPKSKPKQQKQQSQVMPPSTTPPTKQQQQQQQQQQQNHHHKKRYTWLYILLHPHSRHPHSMLFKSIISAIILIDVLFFVASTEEWADHYPRFFYVEEGIVSSIFLIEYFCRLYVAPQSRKYQHVSPNLARWNYAFTITALIDLLSSIPFFLELPFELNLPNLTWIRFFRLLRILKTKSYARSMETVGRVIFYNREILYVAFNMCIFLVLVTAVAMYYLRPKDPEDAEDFQSLTATMYLSAMMLTGQGGPAGDLPWYTKCVVLITGVFSIAVFAIPASMLTWGFEAEAERCARGARKQYLKRSQNDEEEEGEEINGSSYDRPYADYLSSSSEPSDGDTTDQEYLNIIAGGPEDEENGDTQQDDVVKQLIRTFQTSDTDASGTLSMDEFIGLMKDPSSTSQHLTMVGMATSVGLLAQRVQKLEHELKETHQKLDQIVNAVVKKK